MEIEAEGDITMVVEEGGIEVEILEWSGVETLTIMVTIKADKIQEAEVTVYSEAMELTVGMRISQSPMDTQMKSGKPYHKLTRIECIKQGTDLRLPEL